MRNHLLVIGANTPRAPFLRFVEHDAVRVHDVLTSALGFFEPHEGKLLVDQNATSANVRARLHMLGQAPMDHLLMFFTGHGSDVGIHFADGKVLSYDELGRRLKAIPARTKTLVLATCHAGAARRMLEHRVGGFGDGRVRRAWIRALRAACPGLRIIAAVGENAFAHEAPELRSGRFVYAWLEALQRSRGDLRVSGMDFLSELQSLLDAGRILRDWWSDEASPEFHANVLGGTLPLVRSQTDAPIGLAQIESLEPMNDFCAELVMHAFGRRGVTTRVAWDVTAMTGVRVASGCLEVSPIDDATVIPLVLPTNAHRILSDPYLGFWLRNGLGVELCWRVNVLDDVDRILACAVHSSVHFVEARVA